MFKKTRNIALGLIGGLLVLGISPATALNIGVTPSRFELEINKNKTRTQSIRVLNLSSEPVELKASVRSWVMNENNQLQEVAPTAESLDQWIVFTPSQFTIPARGAQTIRFAIRPRVQPKPGEHRAILYLQEVSPANPLIDPTTKMRIISQLGIAIYGYVGDVKRNGVLNSVTVDTKPNTSNAVFDIFNQGNAHVRLNGQYAIWPAAQYPGAEATKLIPNVGKPDAKIPENVLNAGNLPTTPILPDNRRQLRLAIPKNLPPGNYVLDIKGDLSGVAITKGIPFTVPVGSSIEAQTKPPARNLRNNLRR